MAFRSRFSGQKCAAGEKCLHGGTIYAGEQITWNRDADKSKRFYRHLNCPIPPEAEPAPQLITQQQEQPEPHDEPHDQEPEPEEEAREMKTTKEDEGLLDLIGTAILKRLGSQLDQQVKANSRALDARLNKATADLDARITDIVKNLKPSTTITLELTEHGQIVKEISGAHRQLARLIAKLARRKHVYIYGAPGGGKSTAAHMAADALGRRYGYISLNEQSPEYLLTGYKDANGNYQPSIFRDFYENGGVFCIEELDNASGSLLTALNAALENGLASFPDGMVKRHPDFVLVGAGNTSGRGAHPAFPERRPFDAAFADRFYYMEWFYDEDLERAIAKAYNPDADRFVDWCLKARRWCESAGVRVIVSPRCSFRLAELSLDETETEETLIDGVLKGIDADAKAKLLANNPFPKLERKAR